MKSRVASSEIRINISNKQEVEISKKLEITIAIPKNVGSIQKVEVLINRYGESPSIIQEMKITKEDNDFITYSTNVKFENYGNYYFFFSLEMKDENGENRKKAIKINRKTGKPFIIDEWQESPYWIVLVIQDNFEVPNWAKDKIYYQIFVDRFYKSQNANQKQIPGRKYRNWAEMPDWRKDETGNYHNNDFFGGNIKGIEEKLEYLKSLNVGVIYMSPISESGLRYDRYAATNHMQIDPNAGTFKDLKGLSEKAHKMGMYIVLDVAFNHCSDKNPIFQEAMTNPNSKYRDWFYFDEKGNYRYWYNEFKDMPLFNQYNKEFQKYIYGENGVVELLSEYVDGFRLDVAEELQPFFLEGIRNKANEKCKHIIIGEYWNKVNCDILGRSVDTITNYSFTNAVFKYVAYGEDEPFKLQIEDRLVSYPQNTIDTMLNSLDTHDIVRALTMLNGQYMRNDYRDIWKMDEDPSPWHYNTPTGRIFDTEGFRRFEYENDKLTDEQYESAKRKLKISAMIMYLLPGCPCMFYGTEVGLHGYKDPFNRKCFPWDNMDMELLEFFKKLFKFRANCKLAGSKFEVLHINKNILMFKMCNEKNDVLVAVNRTNQEINIKIPEEFESESSKDEFKINATKEKLGPFGGIAILK